MKTTYTGPLEGRVDFEEPEESPLGKKYTTTVKCGDLANPIIVTIENTSYLPDYLFDRDGCKWAFCHSALCLDKEKWLWDTSTTFINIETGENHKTPSLSFWRGSILPSADGKLVIIDAGICASSARKVYVVDLTDWKNVTIIHYEELWTNHEYSVTFNDDNDVVFEYIYEFVSIDDHVHLLEGGSVHDSEFVKYMNDQTGSSEKYSIGEEDIISASGTKTIITVKVTRRRNPDKITKIPFEEKAAEPKIRWEEPKKYKPFYESCIWLDEMDIISCEKILGLLKKRNNKEVTTENFEQFLNK